MLEFLPGLVVYLLTVGLLTFMVVKLSGRVSSQEKTIRGLIEENQKLLSIIRKYERMLGE